MPAVFANSLNEAGISVLAGMFQLDVDLCYSEATILYGMPDYEAAAEVVSLMKKLQHNKIYKNFYKLAVTLLNVPVTTTTCERSHSKVGFVKSAVRSSMK